MFDSPTGPRYHDVSPKSKDITLSKHDLLELVYAYGELHGIDRAGVNAIVEETIIVGAASDCFAKLEKKKPQQKRGIVAGYNYTW